MDGRVVSREENWGVRFFRSAVEAAGHSIYFTDRNGVIEYVNPAFEEMTGYSVDEAVGRTPRILKSGEHDEAFYSDLWETILDGKVWRNQLINARKSGEWYIVDQTIAPIADDDGEITHFVAMNVDVTDRYVYQRQLERQNEHLDEFATILRHDLKSHLSVASGNVELARETGDLSLLSEIDAAFDRMLELTENLMALARSGRTIDAVEPVPLGEVVSDAWSLTATQDATLDLEHSHVELHADRDRLQQALENLFRNAVTHGGADVTVRVGMDGTGIYVEDDGPGIPPDEHDRVFEKGYTTCDDGNGFGLTIVQNVIDAHGWDISVTESDTGGTRFEITGNRFELLALS